MKRRLFNLLTLLSLLLCVAAGGMWVRSHRAHDCVSASSVHWTLAVDSDAGVLSVLTQWSESPRERFPWLAERHDRVIWDPRLLPPVWEAWGFQVRRLVGAPQPGAPPRWTFSALTAPYWAVVTLAALGPTLSLGRALCRRSRLHRGCCAHCGYDLRATPGRCPECGNPAAASPAA